MAGWPAGAEAHRGSESAKHLGDEEVEVIHGWVFDAPLAMGEFEERFVVEDEARISKTAHRVQRKDRVVGLGDHAGDLRRGQDGAAEDRHFRA